MSAVLWLFADVLAKLALARPQGVIFESDISPSEWQVIAFSAIGLWQAINGMIYLVGRLARLAIVHGRPIGLPDDFYDWLVAAALQLVVGIVLMFGAPGLVGAIRRYRQVGMDVATGPEVADSGDSGSRRDGAPP